MISTCYQLTYNGFVARSASREFSLHVEKIRWDTTRRNSGILRPLQKRVHSFTCTVLNLTWRIRSEVKESTDLPEALTNLITDYHGEASRYGPGSFLLTSKDIVKKTGLLTGCSQCFQIKVNVAKEGKLKASFASPKKLVIVLEAAFSKDLRPLTICTRRSRRISLDLVYDDLCSAE